jgi:hypothetical protein
MNPLPALVDLQLLPWTTERKAAAAAVAGPTQLRVMQAALRHLHITEGGLDFAAWCDAQAPALDRPRRSR